MIDINKIKNVIETRLHHTLVGAVSFDHPVYMLHLEFKKPNDDPMFQIDWSIMHFAETDPELDIPSIARIIGMEENLILLRVQFLLDNFYLQRDTTSYVITENGKAVFFKGNNEVYYINESRDFLIDGKTLTIMDEALYQVHPYIYYDNNSDEPERIIVGNGDRDVKNILKKLNHMTDTNLVKYGLPAGSKDFVVVDDPTNGRISFTLVFCIDRNNHVHKVVMYDDRIIKLGSFEKERAYFYNDFKYNHGFTNYRLSEVAEIILDSKKEIVESIVEDFFGIYKKDNKNDLQLAEVSDKQIMVHVSYDAFQLSRKRGKLKKAIKDKEVIYSSKSSVASVVWKIDTIDSKMSEMLIFDEFVEALKKKNDFEGMDYYFEKMGVQKCRKYMILLQNFDILQEFDNYKYIQFK